VNKKDPEEREIIEKNICKFPQQFDLLYKNETFEMNKTSRDFSSLGNYFGWKPVDCKKVRKELCKNYQKDYENYEIAVLSAEESQASTPNQCKKAQKNKNLGKKLLDKGKKCKKNQEGLKILMTSQSLSPEGGELCIKEKLLKPSVVKKSSDRLIFSNFTKNLKEFQRNCQKIKNTSNEARLSDPHSTFSLFQKSFSDLSKYKKNQKDLVSSNLLLSSNSIKSEKLTESQVFSNFSPKSTKNLKNSSFFTFSPKSTFTQDEKISEFSTSSPPGLKAKKVSQNKDSLKLSPRSEKVLSEKLTREFNSLIPESSQDSPTVTYTTFINILKGLHMILDSFKTRDDEKLLAVQLWESLSTDSKLEKSKLLSSILTILRLKSQNSSKSGNFHKKFLLFYSNRLSFNCNIKSPSKPSDFSFHPKINENSRMLMSSISSESSRAEKRCEKMMPSPKTLKLEAEKKKSEDQECTFRPKINNFTVHKKSEAAQSLTDEYLKLVNKNVLRTQALFELASVVQEKRKKMQKIEKIEKNLDEEKESEFREKSLNFRRKNLDFHCNQFKEIQGLDRTFHVSVNHDEKEKSWKVQDKFEELPGDGWDGLKTEKIWLDPRVVESFLENNCETQKLKKKDGFEKKIEKTTQGEKNVKGPDVQLALAKSRSETLVGFIPFP
jgi:hypothetical protein